MLKPRFEVTRRAVERLRADVEVYFVFRDELPEGLEADAHKLVAAEKERRRFGGERGSTLEVALGDARRARKAVLVGLGARGELDAERLREAGAHAARAASSLRAEKVALTIPAVESLEQSLVEERLFEGVRGGFYGFYRYLSDAKKKRHVPASVQVSVGRDTVRVKSSARHADGVASGVLLARDLVNVAPSDMNPETFEDAAAEQARRLGLRLKVIKGRGLERQRMGALSAVGRGSVVPPRVVHLVYKPSGRVRERLAFVGKGITFDSGGYNIKGTGGIETMKCDMAGAAAALGGIAAVAALELPVEVHAVCALAENLVSGNAYKPGDVLTSRAGKTIEINNTDAEGRLALADALDYTKTDIKPDLMVDLATLTGACVVALGPDAAALMTRSEPLAARLLESAARAGEKLWRLPLYEEYKAQLKSPIADMKNTGTRWGGALTAGLFLEEFAGRTRWAHIDLAGPAFMDKDHPYFGRGGTGYGVGTLVELARSA